MFVFELQLFSRTVLHRFVTLRIWSLTLVNPIFWILTLKLIKTRPSKNLKTPHCTYIQCRDSAWGIFVKGWQHICSYLFHLEPHHRHYRHHIRLLQRYNTQHLKHTQNITNHNRVCILFNILSWIFFKFKFHVSLLTNWTGKFLMW